MYMCVFMIQCVCFQSPRKQAPSPPSSPELSPEEIFTMSADDIRHRIQRKKSDKRLQRHSMREKVNMFDQL